MWGPAKDATVPNLVPRHRLEAANQISLATTYGSALPAAAIFAGLTLVDKFYRHVFDGFIGGPIDLALYFNALSFIVSGIVISRLKHIPSGPASVEGDGNAFRVIVDGWKYVGTHARRTRPGDRHHRRLRRRRGRDRPGPHLRLRPRRRRLRLRPAVRHRLRRASGSACGAARGCSRGCRGAGCSGSSLTLTGLLLFPLALVQQLPVVVGLTAVLGFFAGRRLDHRQHDARPRGARRGARTHLRVRRLDDPARARAGAGRRAAARRADRHPRLRPARRERRPLPRLQRRRLHVPDRRGADDGCRCRVLPSDGRPERGPRC